MYFYSSSEISTKLALINCLCLFHFVLRGEVLFSKFNYIELVLGHLYLPRTVLFLTQDNRLFVTGK